MTERRRYTDAEMLAALRMRDQGHSCADIARELGRTRSSIAAMLYNIERDTDHFDTTPHLNVVRRVRRTGRYS
jgi:transcriptional regulator